MDVKSTLKAVTMELRNELEDRFGEIPDPLENLITLQQARIKLGRAGATAVSFKGGRLAVTPIELDAATARRLREILRRLDDLSALIGQEGSD